MGMGEKKIPFVPRHEPVLCDVTLKRFGAMTVHQCKEPSVVSRYGTGGIANVSIYVCKKCKYAKKYEMHGAIGCGYGLE